MGDEAEYISNIEDYMESEYDHGWEDSDFCNLGHRGKGNRPAQRRRRKIRKDRERRLENQKGKYIILADKGYKTLYLQDKNISSGGYWTQFQSNARVFETEESALKVVSYFRLGNPRVVHVV